VFVSYSVIYWTDFGIYAKIEKADYDGSSRQVIIKTDLGLPTGLAVDIRGRFYIIYSLISNTLNPS